MSAKERGPTVVGSTPDNSLLSGVSECTKNRTCGAHAAMPLPKQGCPGAGLPSSGFFIYNNMTGMGHITYQNDPGLDPYEQ